ncbi:MAG: hypothetical protein ABH950_00980 [Candidatus Altiarchaeota archaeon]
MARGKIFWVGTVFLLFAILWAYLLYLRSEVQDLREKTEALEMERDELLRRHHVLLTEQEEINKRLNERETRLTELEKKVGEFKVYQNAWESLHNECLDSLSHCVSAYENVTAGRLDWYRGT